MILWPIRKTPQRLCAVQLYRKDDKYIPFNLNPFCISLYGEPY